MSYILSQEVMRYEVTRDKAALKRLDAIVGLKPVKEHGYPMFEETISLFPPLSLLN